MVLLPFIVGQGLRRLDVVQIQADKPFNRVLLSLVRDAALALLVWTFTGATADRVAGTAVSYPDAVAFFTIVGIAFAYVLCRPLCPMLP